MVLDRQVQVGWVFVLVLPTPDHEPGLQCAEPFKVESCCDKLQVDTWWCLGFLVEAGCELAVPCGAAVPQPSDWRMDLSWIHSFCLVEAAPVMGREDGRPWRWCPERWRGNAILRIGNVRDEAGNLVSQPSSSKDEILLKDGSFQYRPKERLPVWHTDGTFKETPEAGPSQRWRDVFCRCSSSMERVVPGEAGTLAEAYLHLQLGAPRREDQTSQSGLSNDVA